MEHQYIKDYIRLESGKAIDNIETAKSISGFSEALEKEFKSKNCWMQFTSINIPTAKKNLNINNVDTSGFDRKAYENWKRTQQEDTKHMAALRKIVDENSKDEANKDMIIAEHPDVIKLEEKARSCWCCGTLNCLIKQQICHNQKIKRQYLGKCTGQKATFGSNSSYAQAGKPCKV